MDGNMEEKNLKKTKKRFEFFKNINYIKITLNK